MNVLFLKSVIFILCFHGIVLNAQDITLKTINHLSILKSSEVLTIDDDISNKEIIKHKDFKAFKEDYLNLGLSQKTLWIKFTLVNENNSTAKRLVVASSAILEYIDLYQSEKFKPTDIQQVKSISDKFNLTYPAYEIKLPAHTQRIYYLKVKNSVAGIRFGLSLYEKNYYLDKDKKQQFFYGFLLGIVISLLLVSFILFIYTKDINFLYYSLFILATLYWQISYLGLFQIYLPHNLIIYDKYLIALKVNLIFLTSAIFSKKFLQAYKIKTINKIYKIFIYISIVNIFLFSTPLFYKLNISIFFSTTYAFFTVFAAILLYNKGVLQARLYILGSSIVAIVYIIMAFDALGYTSIINKIPNLVLYSIILESMILSFAFIDRYKILQEQKETASYKLLEESKNREQIVQLKVEKQTMALQKSLQKQETLFKELHHRVKNNLQMILSINDLQKSEYQSQETKNIFEKWGTRIRAISKTHELIYMSNDIETIDMYDYIEQLIDNIEESHGYKNITFDYKVNLELPLEKAVYIGLIINELISNSIKYAFEKEGGKIYVELNKDFLQISDNGKGYDFKNTRNYKTGLKLVTLLAEEELQGILEISNKHGTNYKIRF